MINISAVAGPCGTLGYANKEPRRVPLKHSFISAGFRGGKSWILAALQLLCFLNAILSPVNGWKGTISTSKPSWSLSSAISPGIVESKRCSKAPWIRSNLCAFRPGRNAFKTFGNYGIQPSMDDPSIPPNIPGKPNTMPLPVVLPKVDDGKMDIVSRLLKDRILLLGNQVTDEVANVMVAQMLYLASDDPTRDIRLYINSPGGSVTAGMAIFDTMQYVPCDIETVCFGSACSMGAFLLSAGTKGKRRSLPNARIMIHQPLGGAHGQAADIEIQAKEILFTRQLLNTYLSYFTGQPVHKIEEDTDRNFFMTPFEAKQYGLIDDVVKTKISHVKLEPMPSEI
ncbi:ATP-dependent Clp endopeptidase, proteolytic subunit ClpP domain-containing protein [Cardiosporidium cionae]|uniref:ATP-dependent Clp protease proteolytic subunit n=1 Tax=Cardiosporidium cionae TaxID=476202 RepID=A0ABQ7JFH3_9APIC|nr:ATP-dependent Clp endopeptidase, proteolytic subunit ClpP domain-containing protein [Cardiosporidium cionae]|eukprot:KAF8822716.1 ATP-dependent Clp endopeptidase, proteolytic subunit ClpP domain-containing protein [Cardiosporidium cionae]